MHLAWKRWREGCRMVSTQSSGAIKLKKRTLVDVHVDTLDIHGNGIGYDKVTGGKCTVVGAIPGQTWKGRVVQDRTTPVRVVGMELLQQTSQYVEPKCQHFIDCGGCKTQHVPYSLQTSAKEAAVANLLHPIHTSPIDDASMTFRYRNKMEFTVSAGRWLTKRDNIDSNVDIRPSFTIGLFPKSSGTTRKWDGRIIAVTECKLQEDLANRIVTALWSTFEEHSIEAYNFVQHTGILRNITIRVGTTSNGEKQVMIGFGTSKLSTSMAPIVPYFLASLDQSDATSIVSIVQYMDDEMQRRHKEEGGSHVVVLHGQSYFIDSILGSSFRVSLHSFFQPNTAQASVLYSHLVNMISSHEKPPVVWDLFCGVGSIGICLAKHTQHVVGIEIVPDAIIDAKENAKLNGVDDKMSFICADVLKESDRILSELPRPDVIVVDPPRPGLNSALINFICHQVQPEEIIYVSCNPVTQARDLDLMQNYTVIESKPVDMLPHTPHIENIVRMKRSQHKSYSE